MFQDYGIYNHNNNNNNSFASGDDADVDIYDDDDDDDDWLAATKKRKAERKQKRQNKRLAKNTNLDGSKRCGRLLLNHAMNDVEQQKNWSEARKKAWGTKTTKPNQYFYRFNAPGQAQKNGKWTKEEHKLFMQRVKQFGANNEWGIFSKRIPGRVGYQCSNYWRGLVKDKLVRDPNYSIDDNNKLHFKRHTKTFAINDNYRRFAFTVLKDSSKVFTNLPAYHPKRPSQAYMEQVNEALKNSTNDTKYKKRKRKDKKNANDDDYVEPKQKRRRRKTKNDDGDCAFSAKIANMSVIVEEDNPMPDFVDLMTGSNVIKPAISPYGHVLGYETWTKILRTSKTKNLCPFTLQKMTRRSLIKLTKSNYDDYKDQIVNLTKDQISMLAVINS